MIIEIDYNNDQVVMRQTEEDKNPIIFSKIKQLSIVQSMFEEVINSINVNKDDYLDIRLESISEDQRTTIGEW